MNKLEYFNLGVESLRESYTKIYGQFKTFPGHVDKDRLIESWYQEVMDHCREWEGVYVELREQREKLERITQTIEQYRANEA